MHAHSIFTSLCRSVQPAWLHGLHLCLPTREQQSGREKRVSVAAANGLKYLPRTVLISTGSPKAPLKSFDCACMHAHASSHLCVSQCGQPRLHGHHFCLRTWEQQSGHEKMVSVAAANGLIYFLRTLVISTGSPRAPLHSFDCTCARMHIVLIAARRRCCLLQWTTVVCGECMCTHAYAYALVVCNSWTLSHEDLTCLLQPASRLLRHLILMPA